MQGIFQKENTDKALKYGIYRHLPTYEKIIRNLVSFYSIKKIKKIMLKRGNLSTKEKEFILLELSKIENLVYYSNNFVKEDYMQRLNSFMDKIKYNQNFAECDIDYLNRLLKVSLDINLLPGIIPKKLRYKINNI